MTSDALPTPLLRAAILAEGGTDNQISARRRAGLGIIRPGAYLDGGVVDRLGAESRHRLLVATTLPKLAPGAVVSHASAAVLHGLPILGVPPTRVHVTRHQRHGGFSRGHLHTHARPMGDRPPVVINGLPTTDVTQTVIDCACSLDFEAAVVIADAALQRRMTTKAAMEAALNVAGARRGVGQARKVVAFADARSESVGESSSRVRLWRIGFPPPTLQFVVRRGSRFIARCDFCWEEHRTIGEFDGAVKYAKIPSDRDAMVSAMVTEKRREQEVEAERWEVVRWTWTDLADPDALAKIIRGGFARAERLLR